MPQVEDINSVLIDAARDDDTDIMLGLLEVGADVNAKDIGGYTALMWAAGLGHIDTVKLILDHGADVNVRNNYKNTALALAEKEEVVNLLTQAGACYKQRED